MNYIRVLTIYYDQELAHFEIPLFRGAILGVLGNQADLAFHNHVGEGFNYTYPLIQYKRIHQKAAIVCVNDGTEVIGQLLSKGSLQLAIGSRMVDFTIAKVVPQRIATQLWTSTFKYHLRRWLPLNAENYQLYRSLETEIERIQLLERLLTAHLISFLKGTGIWLEQELVCRICTLSPPYLLKNKGIRLTAFDATFSTNLSLPAYVGIGKNSSIGFGVISPYNPTHTPPTP